MATKINDETKCERCGIQRKDTAMNILAYRGPVLVCEICNSELDEIENDYGDYDEGE